MLRKVLEGLKEVSLREDITVTPNSHYQPISASKLVVCPAAAPEGPPAAGRPRLSVLHPLAVSVSEVKVYSLVRHSEPNSDPRAGAEGKGQCLRTWNIRIWFHWGAGLGAHRHIWRSLMEVQ